MRENKMEIIMAMENVLRKTRYCDNIQIIAGRWDYNGNCFIACHNKEELANVDCLCLEMYGRKIYQSIEADSGIAIIYDILKAVDRF